MVWPAFDGQLPIWPAVDGQRMVWPRPKRQGPDSVGPFWPVRSRPGRVHQRLSASLRRQGPLPAEMPPKVAVVELGEVMVQLASTPLEPAAPVPRAAAVTV